MNLTITLAGPPRGKGRPRATVMNGHARVYPDPKTAKYETQLRYAAQQQMGDQAPTAQPVRVTVVATLQRPTSGSRIEIATRLATGPIGRGSGDADNYLKILDALNGIIWQDDCQIIEAYVTKRWAPIGAGPGLTVHIETIEPEPIVVPPRQSRRKDAATDLAPGDLLAGIF